MTHIARNIEFPVLSKIKQRHIWSTDGLRRSGRELANETPIAIVFNGSTAAVMMASAENVADFALGFAITEGFIRSRDDVESFEEIIHERGIEARFWLKEDCAKCVASRRRSAMGPMGCGLCGIDSLENALRSVPSVESQTAIPAEEIAPAGDDLRQFQPLQDLTRSAHAAGFLQPRSGICCAREDVGRHNALDKLAGALIAQAIDPAAGAIVVTSRLSVDLVQKTAMIGCPILIGVSGPSCLAVETAHEVGVTLVGFCRSGSFEVFTHPRRILGVMP